MTDKPVIFVEPIPTLPQRLAAGRRAAMQTLCASQGVTLNPGSPTPDEYNGEAPINFNGTDIGPSIDAAVMETMAAASVTTVEPDPLIAQMEELLAAMKAGRVVAAAIAWLDQDRVGAFWHNPKDQQLALGGAIDRLLYLWREANYKATDG